MITDPNFYDCTNCDRIGLSRTEADSHEATTAHEVA